VVRDPVPEGALPPERGTVLLERLERPHWRLETDNNGPGQVLTSRSSSTPLSSEKQGHGAMKEIVGVFQFQSLRDKFGIGTCKVASNSARPASLIL